MIPIILAAIFFVIWCKVFSLAVTEEKSDDKVIWSLVVFFGGPFGVLMYLFIRLPMLKQEERMRDFEMLQKMREEFESSHVSGAKQ